MFTTIAAAAMKWWVVATLSIGMTVTYKVPFDTKALCDKEVPAQHEALSKIIESMAPGADVQITKIECVQKKAPNQ